jgi:hypothetical protein
MAAQNVGLAGDVTGQLALNLRAAVIKGGHCQHRATLPREAVNLLAKKSVPQPAAIARSRAGAPQRSSIYF